MAGPAVHGVRAYPKWLGRGRPEEPQEGITWLRGQVAVLVGKTAEVQLSSEPRFANSGWRSEGREDKRSAWAAHGRATWSTATVETLERRPKAHEGIGFRIGL